MCSIILSFFSVARNVFFIDLCHIKNPHLLNSLNSIDMRSITTFDLQYAHRFYRFQGEAQYLHGHTGVDP